MALLDQEAAAALGAETANDRELGLGQAKPLHVFLAYRLGVGKEDLGHALLDHGAADRVAQDVRGALGVEDPQAVLLADGLLLLLGEVAEDRVIEGLPKFGD